MGSGNLGHLASRRNVLVVLLLSALIAGGLIMVYFSSDGHKPVIRFVGSEYDSMRANNAIAKFIIEKGYGYPVEITDMTNTIMEDAMPKGEIDIKMEGWQQNRIDWYNKYIENGKIVNLGITYEAGPQFWIIPKRVAEEYNIKTVFDMKYHWELFKDPKDPTKGTFCNSIIGWASTDINIIKLEAYGLDRYYNNIIPSSTDAMDAVLVKAQINRQPVFGYYWAPNALMGAYDWHILEEPPYTDECWEKIISAKDDENLRPIDEACAFEAVPIDKIAHSGLQKKAPDVVEMLRKMNVGLEPLNKVLAWAKENNVEDWEEAAVYYLQNYEDRWETWITPDAYKNIKKAMEES